MNNQFLKDFMKMRQGLSGGSVPTPLGGLPSPAGMTIIGKEAPASSKKKMTKKERAETKAIEVAASLDALIESNPGKKDVARFFQHRADELGSDK